jgi:hypothetical protein
MLQFTRVCGHNCCRQQDAAQQLIETQEHAQQQQRAAAAADRCAAQAERQQAESVYAAVKDTVEQLSTDMYQMQTMLQGIVEKQTRLENVQVQ